MPTPKIFRSAFCPRNILKTKFSFLCLPACLLPRTTPPFPSRLRRCFWCRKSGPSKEGCRPPCYKRGHTRIRGRKSRPARTQPRTPQCSFLSRFCRTSRPRRPPPIFRALSKPDTPCRVCFSKRARNCRRADTSFISPQNHRNSLCTAKPTSMF